MSRPLPSPGRRALVLPLGLLLLAAALAAGLGALGRAPSQAARPSPTVAEQTSGPSDEVTRLENELRLLRRQVQGMAHQQGAASRASADVETPAPATPPPSPQEILERDHRHFQALDRKLAREPVDPRWAAATERLIASALQGPPFKGSTLVGTSCHSTMCRFEVRHQSPEDQRRFGNSLPTRLPSLPSGSMRRNGGPSPSTVVYAAREGHQLPRDGQD